MQLLGPYSVHGNEFIPFTTTITSWADDIQHSLIRFEPKTNHFIIENATTNDYLVLWCIELKTATMSNNPIIGLEFLYGQNTRRDYCIAPCKTVQIGNTSIYHITEIANPDVLSIGLMAVGNNNDTYCLSSESNYNIAATINIIGL